MWSKELGQWLKLRVDRNIGGIAVHYDIEVFNFKIYIILHVYAYVSISYVNTLCENISDRYKAQ